MKEPPVMQNVGLVSSFYSQEVVCLSWKNRGRLVKISDLKQAGLLEKTHSLVKLHIPQLITSINMAWTIR
jgi:hypothetical protein